MSRVYEPEGRRARPFFLVVPYERRADGRLLPAEVPDQGPCVERSGPCRIVRNGLRHRSCGPPHPLQMLYCSVHGLGFTVYPPGYAPYLRAPLASVAPDGAPVPVVACNEDPTTDGRLLRFAPTYFGAAVDAAAGRIWLSESECEGDTALRRCTQARRLQRACDWLGISPDLGLDDRHERAQVLSVGTLTLLEGAKTLEGRPGLCVVGRALGTVLSRLPTDRTLPERLTWAAHLSGYLGRPRWWDPVRHALRSLPFRRAGTVPRPPDLEDGGRPRV